MNKPSILFIITSFLSENTAVGRAARPFVENLAKKGCKVGVVCFPGDMKVDDSISLYVVKKNPLILLGCRILEHFSFFKLINRPDASYLCWKYKVVKKVLNIIQTEKYGVIHTISFPCSSHIIGYQIKKKPY